MNLISTIRQNSPNIRNSKLILSNFKEIQKSELNSIEKSIVDDLNYNPDLKIEKTGKEIKANLVSLRSDVENQKDLFLQTMIELKKTIGVDPVENFSSYMIDRLGTKLDLPKQYSHNQRYPSETKTITYPKVEEVDFKSQESLMVQYNGCGYNYLNLLNDIRLIDTLLRNLSDNKKITLSVQQAAALGF